MIARNITISFSVSRLKLIEQALKKSERLFEYQNRKQIRGARRQVEIRLHHEQQKRDEQKVDVERKLQG